MKAFDFSLFFPHGGEEVAEGVDVLVDSLQVEFHLQFRYDAIVEFVLVVSDELFPRADGFFEPALEHLVDLNCPEIGARLGEARVVGQEVRVLTYKDDIGWCVDHAIKCVDRFFPPKASMAHRGIEPREENGRRTVVIRFVEAETAHG